MPPERKRWELFSLNVPKPWHAPLESKSLSIVNWPVWFNISLSERKRQSDLATERERQLTTKPLNQTTGLTNGRAANWASEVEFSPFRALSRRQMTFPFCY